MSRPVARREFLRHCAAVTAGAGALAAGRPAAAIEPIARNGKSFFKFSLAAYSYRDLLNAKPPAPKLSLDDFIITLFNAGSRVTYPLYVYGARRAAFPPQINVLATAILAGSLMLLGAIVLWQQRSLRQMQGDGPK